MHIGIHVYFVASMHIYKNNIAWSWMQHNGQFSGIYIFTLVRSISRIGVEFIDNILSTGRVPAARIPDKWPYQVNIWLPDNWSYPDNWFPITYLCREDINKTPQCLFYAFSILFQ